PRSRTHSPRSRRSRTGEGAGPAARARRGSSAAPCSPRAGNGTRWSRSTSVSGAERLEDPAAVLEEGRRVLRLEAAAVAALEGRLGDGFVEACRLVAGAAGRIVVSGIGKSGIVARKIAATLTSTGTPAVFLHPIEGLHGDLG